MYQSWEELENECKKCTKCKLSNNRNSVVIGTGNKNAKIMFIIDLIQVIILNRYGKNFLFKSIQQSELT